MLLSSMMMLNVRGRAKWRGAVRGERKELKGHDDDVDDDDVLVEYYYMFTCKFFAWGL